MWCLGRSALVVVVLAGLADAARAEPSFAGTWDTTFGRMHLHQEKAAVAGFYVVSGQIATMEGTLEQSRWTFHYREPHAEGEGHFDLAADGREFSGRWRPKANQAWQSWSGRRVAPPERIGTFAGVWSTSFGKMRLTTSGDAARGCYAFPAGSTLEGSLAGDTLAFEYREPEARGEGWFQLAADGRSFHGQWRTEGGAHWHDWYGQRVEPVPGRSWLVVIEAHWEHDLAEPEYSFGSMLRAFFARSPNVQVRHRYANSSRDVVRACEEIAYLTEPVVLVVASHGTGEGVGIGADVVGAEAFVEGLRYVPKLRLLHFSSCAVMGGVLAEQIRAGREAGGRFPISGYTQGVDWAASAVIEFLYFDLILARGMPAARAAEQVRRLMPFAGDTPLEGAALPPAGFRILLPKDR